MADVTPINTVDYDPTVSQNKGSDNVMISAAGNALLAHGTTVPTDGDSGYAIGCLYIHTDGGAGTALYVNEGTAASCDFDAVTVA